MRPHKRIVDRIDRIAAAPYQPSDAVKTLLAASMTLGVVFLVAAVLRGVFAADTTSRDCAGETLWGGANGTTTYTTVSYPGMGTQLLAQSSGASLPVQSTPYGMINMPQTTVPGMGVGNSGAVGSVGHPATSPNAFVTDHLPPGSVIRFARPVSSDNTAGISAVADSNRQPLSVWEIVPEGTPGAVAVTVKETTVYRPETESRCVFGPVTHTVTREKRLVDPRTGRVIKRWLVTEDVPSWWVPVPILHTEERTTLKPVRVQVATPIPAVAPTQPNSRAEIFRAEDSMFPSVADTIPVIPVMTPTGHVTSYPPNGFPAFGIGGETSSRLTIFVTP